MPCLANSPANTIQMNVKKETIFFCFRFFFKRFSDVCTAAQKTLCGLEQLKKKIEHIWHPSNTVKHKKTSFFKVSNSIWIGQSIF